MSILNRYKTVVAVAVAVFAATGAVGCGDDPVDAGAPGATTGPSAAAPTADTGATGATDSSATEPARVGTLLVLNKGKFVEGTPAVVHVESGIDVQLDFQAQDDRPYTVNINGPGGPSSVQVPGGGTNAYLGAALKPGETITASYGGSSVDVVADAEPGP